MVLRHARPAALGFDLRTSAKKRDTLRNIRETGQLAINLAGVNMMEKVLPTARHSLMDVKEFLEARVGEKPSLYREPPGIAGCYEWIKCEHVKEYEVKVKGEPAV